MSQDKIIQSLILRANVAISELQVIKEELQRLCTPTAKKKKQSALTDEQVARLLANRRRHIERSISKKADEIASNNKKL